MPRLIPESPTFQTASEREVWERLRDSLAADDVLIANLRLTDTDKDVEADLVVLMPEVGILVLEVKGGSVWRADGQWRTNRQGHEATIDPVDQVRDTRYAIRQYVAGDPRWHGDGRRRVRWSHAVVPPNTDLPNDFSCPDAPRWMVADRTDLDPLDVAWHRMAIGAAVLLAVTWVSTRGATASD